MRHTHFSLSTLVLVLILTAGCEPAANRGLVLPEGDAVKGQETFVRLQCNACHRVKDVEMLDNEDGKAYSVTLGGQRNKDYAELVTSIINPSHRIAGHFRDDGTEITGQSPMANYNDVMTVTELVNLVEFLKEQYKVERIPHHRYSIYTHPD